MKTFLKTQLQHELIGQAILELITDKLPISEQMLLKQLRKARESTTNQERRAVLQELIVEFSNRAKIIPSDAMFTVSSTSVRNENKEADDAELLTHTPDPHNKFH